MTEGRDVTFDIRLWYNRSGQCQCIEEVTLLRIKKENYSNSPIFNCDEVEENCQNKSGFIVERETATESTPYNFFLVLPSVTVSNSGMYFVEIEVKQPGFTATRRFWKIFQLIVNSAHGGRSCQ